MFIKINAQNDGKELKPTVLIGNPVLPVPTDQQLRAALEREDTGSAAVDLKRSTGGTI